MKNRIAALLLLPLLLFSLLSGCSKSNSTSSDQSQNDTASKPQSDTVSSVEQTEAVTRADMFTDRDCDPSYEENSAVTITLNGDSATASSDSVRISNGIITLTEEATYLINGTLNDGMIVVDASDQAKLRLVLCDTAITCATSAPLYIKEADKVFVTLVGENTLENGGDFVAVDDNNIDAAVFSKQDLTFNGSGSLTVTSPAGHGIVGKDDLVFTSGSYQITSCAHAIDANDSVRIKDASITCYAGKDGIHAENNDDAEKGFIYIESGSFTLQAEGDGISAGADLQIMAGSYQITAGGGHQNAAAHSSDNWGNFGGGMHGGRPGGRSSTNTTTTDTSEESTSMKGLKSGTTLTVYGGSFTMDVADDAVHANTSAFIYGGSYEIATGDDAFHAEDTLTVTDGSIHISTSYEGLEALHLVVSGGDIKLVSSDDGLNAAGSTGGRDGMFGKGMGGNSDGSILISGGTLYINASGDGIDANGTLEITGGHTTVVGPTQGDTATLDYDKTATISGGTFIGTGASGMAQSITGSGQGVIALSVGQQAAGTQITLTDKNGNEVISYAPELSFQVVILSSPDIIKGESYTITVGTATGTFDAE